MALMRLLVLMAFEILSVLLLFLLRLLVARVGSSLAAAEVVRELPIEFLVEALLLLFVASGG